MSETTQQNNEQITYIVPNTNIIVVEEIIDQVPITNSTQESVENQLCPITTKPTPIIAPSIPVEHTIPVVESEPFDFKRYYDSIQARQWLESACNTWRTCDSDIAFHITEFKRQYVFPIGDIPVRSVLMAVSTGLTYALLGRINPSFLGRARNLGINFVLNGSFWLPELFNPFLFLQNRS